MTCRITTWNVNGLRATFNKGALDWLQSDPPEVLCLQEIKVRPDQLREEDLHFFDSYHSTWNPASRPGYSGVATFSRCEAREVVRGLGREDFDAEGRVIVHKFTDFILFNIYFPNGQRGHDRLDFKLGFYAYLLKILDECHRNGENVIVCGDFNTAHREIDLRNPKENKNTSGFLPEERAWIDEYLAHDLVDAYRRLYPDRVQYTWWTYITNARARNVGWRLDYFLLSEKLMSSVKDVIIHEELGGSDHCPVSLILD
jgi:exodeoxyribonuclease-3